MDPNISNQPGGPYQSTPVGGPSGETSTGSSLGTGYNTHDTLSKSDMATLATMVFFANYPILPPPGSINGNDSEGISGISSAKDFRMYVTLKMDEIKTQILDSWAKNLAEIQQQIRDELKSPRYLAWQEQNSPAFVANVEMQASVKALTNFQSYLNSLAPNDRIEEMDSNKQYMLRIGLINGLENYQQSVNTGSASAAEALPFVAAVMVIGSTFIGPLAAKPETAVAMSPEVQFMQSSINFFVPLIPGDVRAELGLLGALFALGALNLAAASNLVAKAGGEKAGDHELAINYAQNVINLMANGVLSSFAVGAMIDKMEGSNKMSDARKLELTSMIKIAIMANAVGALYKADTKWITGQEFLDLIDGKLHLTEKDANGNVTKYLLSKDIVEQLEQLLPLINKELTKITSGTERTKMRQALYEYMESNPDYKKMFSVNKSISGVFETTPYQPVSDK